MYVCNLYTICMYVTYVPTNGQNKAYFLLQYINSHGEMYSTKYNKI